MASGSANGVSAPLTTLLAQYTHRETAALEDAVLAVYSADRLSACPEDISCG